MHLFQNTLIIFVIIGIITRICDWILFHYTKLTKKASVHISMIITIIITAPIVATFVGFDVLISSYLISVLGWLIIDLLWLRTKE